MKSHAVMFLEWRPAQKQTCARLRKCVSFVVFCRCIAQHRSMAPRQTDAWPMLQAVEAGSALALSAAASSRAFCSGLCQMRSAPWQCQSRTALLRNNGTNGYRGSCPGAAQLGSEAARHDGDAASRLAGQLSKLVIFDHSMHRIAPHPHHKSGRHCRGGELPPCAGSCALAKV